MPVSPQLRAIRLRLGAVRPPTRLIFREYASGLYSLKSLARKLDADTYVRAVIPATKTNESAPSEGGSEPKTGLRLPERTFGLLRPSSDRVVMIRHAP